MKVCADYRCFSFSERWNRFLMLVVSRLWQLSVRERDAATRCGSLASTWRHAAGRPQPCALPPHRSRHYACACIVLLAHFKCSSLHSVCICLLPLHRSCRSPRRVQPGMATRGQHWRRGWAGDRAMFEVRASIFKWRSHDRCGPPGIVLPGRRGVRDSDSVARRGVKG
jgi:hypothetical protein